MRKMPCLFVRQFHDDRTFTITPEVTPGCEWVTRGEGVATAKWDGTSCAIIGGRLHARYDAKRGKAPPANGVPCDPAPDPVTGHWPHWVPVGEEPQFKYHREAWANRIREYGPASLDDGTYELCGPKVQGNPHGFAEHKLVDHDYAVLFAARRDFDGLREMLRDLDFEGIVFHHRDGRMAKIRRDDFGYEWPIKAVG